MKLHENDNPRLQLKPVKAFNQFLLDTFKPGRCTCHRCVDAGHTEEGYAQPHTFEINGQLWARQFACSGESDVIAALEAAWKAYFKADMPATGAVELDSIHEFTAPASQSFLIPLMLGSLCAHEADDLLRFGPPRSGVYCPPARTISVPAPAADKPADCTPATIEDKPLASSPFRAIPSQATLDLFDE